MSFLIDTNLLSELRRPGKANPGALAWATSTTEDQVFLSVITLHELEKGIVKAERRRLPEALLLRTWLDLEVRPGYAARTLPVTTEIALRAAAFFSSKTVELADELIAATALVHDLTVVTRNITHFEHTGVRLLDPFTPT